MFGMSSWNWEGKGFVYTFKYACRHAPEVMLSIPFFCIYLPALAFYAYKYKEEEILINSRFKNSYIVLRDDDPDVKRVIRVDEEGKLIKNESEESENGK